MGNKIGCGNCILRSKKGQSNKVSVYGNKSTYQNLHPPHLLLILFFSSCLFDYLLAHSLLLIPLWSLIVVSCLLQLSSLIFSMVLPHQHYHHHDDLVMELSSSCPFLLEGVTFVDVHEELLVCLVQLVHHHLQEKEINYQLNIKRNRAKYRN